MATWYTTCVVDVGMIRNGLLLDLLHDCRPEGAGPSEIVRVFVRPHVEDDCVEVFALGRAPRAPVGEFK